uniref:F-box domain-containing protein n=1 Tax=Kalanchoe fedtschenkoi TaxID=63787 RepID=A0A7N0RBU0_KALFE
MSSRDWSDLPPDLLHSISLRLLNYSDFLRFRAVSRHFHSSTSATPTHLPTQLPWLLLPQTLSATPTSTLRRALYDISLDKFHFLPGLDLSNRKRCCGSSHGWLFILDEYPTITLLNALTADRLHLPPLSTFSNVVSLDFSNVGREYTLRNKAGVLYTSSLWRMRDMFIKKIVLSGSPVNNRDFAAMAILNQSSELGYCKNGDKSWSIVDGVEGCEDVVFSNGLFYAVNKTGCVMSCDVSGPWPKVCVIDTARIDGGDMHYLVGVEEGLLFVSRYLDMVYEEDFDQPDVMYKTIGFTVFRMDLCSGLWEKMTSLGDRALFLGENSSLCLVAYDYVGCKGNCIYFTDDYSASNCDGYWGDFDLGVYNLVDDSIEPLVSCPRNSRTGLRWPPPIWVTPNPL